jgi:hypothetical protein
MFGFNVRIGGSNEEDESEEEHAYPVLPSPALFEKVLVA